MLRTPDASVGPGIVRGLPACFWEDDPVQLLDPTYRRGANGPSLMECQAIYRRAGGSEERMLPHVRLPTESAEIDAEWRPVQDGDVPRCALRWTSFATRELAWLAIRSSSKASEGCLANHSSRTFGKRERRLAGSTGLEPAASGVTGRRSNQLNYDPEVELNGRYRTRTCDSRRVKPVLYQLS